MSEVAFCKSFLSALDARPAKLSSDHIADARQYPAQGAYTLPRLPHPPHPSRPNPKSTSSANDASSPSTINISLKPMKPTSPTVPLSSIEPSKTSIFDLKQQYSTSTSIPAAKIKILYKKKPVTDSKTVAEVIGSEAGEDVEFSVMVLGGAVAGGGTPPVASPPAAAPSEADKGLAGSAGQGSGAGAAAVGPSGKEVVATEEFWSDLNNFVLQRIKDEQEGERLVGVFRGAWEGSK
ncbi:Nn.00g068300.m01.CDS01 [Neocucurbitaria sp. VM-36]